MNPPMTAEEIRLWDCVAARCCAAEALNPDLDPASRSSGFSPAQIMAVRGFDAADAFISERRKRFAAWAEAERQEFIKSQQSPRDLAPEFTSDERHILGADVHEWRLLGAGDVRREGDEYRAQFDGLRWRMVDCSFGFYITEDDAKVMHYRRKRNAGDGK